MRAAVYNGAPTADGGHLRVEDVPLPQLHSGHVLLRVIACGVCRTDLHIVEGDLQPLRPRLIPGHQIVGEVVEGATEVMPKGSRVGVSWMGGTDGNCWFCKHQMENLCDHPTCTGYTIDGGYAEYALVRSDFTFPSRKVWMRSMSRLSYARASSGFGVCVSPGCSRVSGLDCSGSAARLRLRCRFCSPGDARLT